MYTKTSSAILKAMVSDGSGFGKLVFSRSAELFLDKAEGLPLETGVTGNLQVENVDSGKNAAKETFVNGEGKWEYPIPLGSLWEFGWEPPSDSFVLANGATVKAEEFPDLAMTGDITLPNEQGKYIYLGKKV